MKVSFVSTPEIMSTVFKVQIRNKHYLWTQYHNTSEGASKTLAGMIKGILLLWCQILWCKNARINRFLSRNKVFETSYQMKDVSEFPAIIFSIIVKTLKTSQVKNENLRLVKNKRMCRQTLNENHQSCRNTFRKVYLYELSRFLERDRNYISFFPENLFTH